MLMITWVKKRRQSYLGGGGESLWWRNRSSSDSRSCSNTSGWGRGMCVTMWREKAWVKGDACCLGCVSCFLGKLTLSCLSSEWLRRRKLTVFCCFLRWICTICLRIFRINWGGCFSPLLKRRRREKRGQCWRKKPDRPAASARCAPSERSLNTGPDSQDWTVWGGGREWKERKIRWMTSIQYKCSIHCCFCIQPLDSVKCFNICAILNYFKNNCLHWPKVYSFIETIAYKCLFLFCFFSVNVYVKTILTYNLFMFLYIC